MCGIAGVLGDVGRSAAVERTRVLIAAQAHRGPDHWATTADSLEIPGALGYCRLAIVGIGGVGNQPIVSPSGRFVLVFNGEIYNYRELSSTYHLGAPPSDGHVIAALWELKGSSCLQLLRGMFAVAVYDTTEANLTLARDRYGIKPLYLRCTASSVEFASDVRTIGAGCSLGPAAVATFLSLGALPADQSPFDGVDSLAPGHLRTFGFVDGRFRAQAAVRFVDDEAPSRQDVDGGFRQVLLDSVRAHLVADVEVAHLMSAGVDSSLIAYAARELGVSLRCITVDTGPDCDEVRGARRLSSHFGHSLEVVTSEVSESGLEAFFGAMQRPSIDGLNTFVVTEAVRRAGFKVALSGLGGDEAMAGYGHARLLKLLRARQHEPARLVARAVASVGKHVGRVGAKQAKFLTDPELVNAWLLCRLQRQVLGDDVVSRLVGTAASVPAVDPPDQMEHGLDLFAWAQAERHLYLQSTLLPDSDSFSMANSVELRVPFVDHELRAYTLMRAHPTLRRSGKEAFVRELGDPALLEAVRRPKTGFGLPMVDMLKGGPLNSRLTSCRNSSAPIWDHLDRAAGLPLLRDEQVARRWSEAWVLVSLNSWLVSLGEHPGGGDGATSASQSGAV